VLATAATIPYVIERGRRRKTVAIVVDPLDGVRVRAPGDTSITRLDVIVHRKARWILERQRRHEDLPPPPSSREFVSGETFRYLGRKYRLKLHRSGDAEARRACPTASPPGRPSWASTRHQF
jgi:predicted metal-dependent hydrolase